MIVNRGHWNELPEQCKKCENIQVLSLYMNGNHYYACNKYPLKDSDETCPRFIRREDVRYVAGDK